MIDKVLINIEKGIDYLNNNLFWIIVMLISLLGIFSEYEIGNYSVLFCISMAVISIKDYLKDKVISEVVDSE